MNGGTRFAWTVALIASIHVGIPRSARASDGDPVVAYTIIGGYPAEIEVFMRQQPGVDPQATTTALLRAAHLTPLPSDQFFFLGFAWGQFFDHGRHDDFVVQSYNPAGDPTGGAALGAVLAAQQTWSEVSGSTFRMAFGGTTDRCPSLASFAGSSCPGGPARDGHNDIGWIALSPQILGVTATIYDPSTGAAVEGDIALNATPPAPFSWFTDGRDIDVQTAVLHEDGHLAGLAHSTDPNAVMWPFDNGVKRALTADETDALTVLYPIKPSVVSQTPSAYDFRVLATLGDPAPGGATFSNDFEPGAVNGRGDVAFVADVPEGEGLFVARNGTVTQVIRSGQVLAPGVTLGFGAINNVGLNDSGEIAFSWALEPVVQFPFGSDAGLFRASADGSVQSLVLPGVTPAPGGGVFEGSNHAAISNQGDIAFAGLVDTPQGPAFGVFLARPDGSLASVVRPGDPAPGGDVFLSANVPAIGDSGDVAFVATVARRPGAGVYVWRAASNTIEPVARPGDPIPGGGIFERAVLPCINARGDVLFVGGTRITLTFGSHPFSETVFGVYLATAGRIVPIAQHGDVMPDGWLFNSLFLGTSSVAIGLNDSGDVAFLAGTMQRDGPVFNGAVYASSHQTLRLVAANGGFVPGLGVVAGFGDPATAFVNARGNVVLQVGTFDSQFNFHVKLLEAGPLAK